VTAPAVGDDILAAHINLFLQRPMCRLVQQATQSIPTGTATALTFGASSEEFDYTPAPFHDTSTNNTRITPTVAGWYRFEGCYFSSAINAARTVILRKNGTTLIAPGPRDQAPNITSSLEVGALIQCNGTTDYVELLGQQSSGSSKDTNVATQQSSTFECWLVRLA